MKPEKTIRFPSSNREIERAKLAYREHRQADRINICVTYRNDAGEEIVIHEGSEALHFIMDATERALILREIAAQKSAAVN